MPNLSTPQSASSGANPFLEADIPDSEEIYEPTPFGISAITNVDRLMDEVFGGVEQMLERGAVLPSDLHEPEKAVPLTYPQAGSGFVPPLLMPSCVTAPPVSAAAYLSAAALNGYSPNGSSSESSGSSSNDIPSTQSLDNDLFNDPDLDNLLVIDSIPAPRKAGGGIVLSAILATLILTGGLFVTFKFRLYRMIPGMTEGTTEATVPESATGKDQQFLDYVGRSLNRIDRTATRTNPSAISSSYPQGVAAVPPVPGVTALPTPPVLPMPTVVTVPAAPVFGSFTNQPPAQLSTVKTSPVPGTVPGTVPRAVPGTVAARPAAPSAAAPRAARPTAVRPAAPAARSAPSLPVIVPPTPVVTALTPNVDLSETHALIGLLELGDRSAALLEVNGVPQRIQVGEKIGGSGWQVMSISNQAAIIQRNGEVRSIYVGQQF